MLNVTGIVVYREIRFSFPWCKTEPDSGLVGGGRLALERGFHEFQSGALPFAPFSLSLPGYSGRENDGNVAKVTFLYHPHAP